MNNHRLASIYKPDGDMEPGVDTVAVPQIASGADNGVLMPGAIVLDNYEIVEKIGCGGMGCVYRALNVTTGRDHAVKVLRPELARQPAMVQAFTREAQALEEVRHDAVVAYNHLARDTEGRLFLVMEYVDGPSLAKRLEDGCLTPGEVRRLRDRLAAGLAAAHRKVKAHRDLSPDNIILPGGRLDEAKIIDFGIAKAADPSAGTIAGPEGFTGKYLYASPEQFHLYDGEVDARTDIYSLGLVLAEAASGRPLDMGNSRTSREDARRRVPDLSSVPAELRNELAMMLQPRTADRPGSMEELLERSRIRRRPWYRQPGYLLTAGVAGMAALLLLFWFWFPVPFDPSPPKPGGDPETVDAHPSAPDLPTSRETPEELYRIAMERLRAQDADGALPYFNVAAQQGHGPAALEMARMYDPELRDRVASPLSKPNVEKAIAWYRRALAAGQTAAAERLRILEETR